MRFLYQIAPAFLLLTAFVFLWNCFADDNSTPPWLSFNNKHAPADAPPAALYSSLHGTATKPPSRKQNKALVIAAMSTDDTSWVRQKLPDWGRAIYTMDAQEAGIETPFSVPQNKGNEGNAFLWHIIRHYHELPEIVVFLHSHEEGAWHIDNKNRSNLVALNHLRLDTVRRQGFANLRCQHLPGCPAGVELDWQYSRRDLQAEQDPFGVELDTSEAMPEALMAMFPDGIEPNAKPKTGIEASEMYPRQIAAPCCGQFAVTRRQILQRPKSDYERYHRWLMATTLDNYRSGRVMELLWHIIFGQPAVYCPDMDQCFLDNYGPDYAAYEPPLEEQE